jgi:hypothetical protein
MALSAPITELSLAGRVGRRAALDELLSLVHLELCRLALRHVRGERAGATLLHDWRPALGWLSRELTSHA